MIYMRIAALNGRSVEGGLSLAKQRRNVSQSPNLNDSETLVSPRNPFSSLRQREGRGTPSRKKKSPLGVVRLNQQFIL